MPQVWITNGFGENPTEDQINMIHRESQLRRKLPYELRDAFSSLPLEIDNELDLQGQLDLMDLVINHVIEDVQAASEAAYDRGVDDAGDNS